MKFYLDTEFIEDGTTIDLISIGLVAEDGRKMYLQNADCKFSKASDWVWRNVFPSLKQFNMAGHRSCNAKSRSLDSKDTARCYDNDCPWRGRYEIRAAVLEFCDAAKWGKPEFWGYYADYDWVVFCRLFGTMTTLPKGWPMYCRDIKQLCDDLGNPELPAQSSQHNALLDAEWTQFAHQCLIALQATGRIE